MGRRGRGRNGEGLEEIEGIGREENSRTGLGWEGNWRGKKRVSGLRSGREEADVLARNGKS